MGDSNSPEYPDTAAHIDAWLDRAKDSNDPNLDRTDEPLTFDEIQPIAGKLRRQLRTVPEIANALDERKKRGEHAIIKPLVFRKGNYVYYYSEIDESAVEDHVLVNRDKIKPEEDPDKVLAKAAAKTAGLLPFNWEEELIISDYRGPQGDWSISDTNITVRGREDYADIRLDDGRILRNVGLTNSRRSVAVANQWVADMGPIESTQVAPPSQ